MEAIETKIRQLPPHLQAEVVDFIDFLLVKTKSTGKKRPKLHWIGGLKQYRNQYSALELQEMASKWRD